MQAHVTLLVPFTPPAQLAAGRIREVRDAIGEFEAFDFELTSTCYFDLASRRVLYLRPEPPDRFVRMIDALVECFPEHPPYGKQGLEPVPHLGIATSPDDALLERIELAVQPELPLAASAIEAWIVEYGEGACDVRNRIPLRQPT